jgi:hypothetical protein
MSQICVYLISMEVLMLSICITTSFESCVIFTNVAHANEAKMYFQIIWKCIETCAIFAHGGNWNTTHIDML